MGLKWGHWGRPDEVLAQPNVSSGGVEHGAWSVVGGWCHRTQTADVKIELPQHGNRKKGR